MKKNKKLNVHCPHCKKEFNYYQSKFRPFCCKQCKMIDMGSWLNEGYVVEGKTNSVYIEEPERLSKLLDHENNE